MVTFEKALENAVHDSGVHPSRVEMFGARRSRRESSSEKKQNSDLCSPDVHGQYILYWVTTSARLQDNPTLALVLALSRELQLPAVALATIDLSAKRNSSIRHIAFLIEGFSDFTSSLSSKGIDLFFRIDPNMQGSGPSLSVVGSSCIPEYGRSKFSVKQKSFQGFASNASVVVADKQFMPLEIQSVSATAELVQCPFIIVNSATLFPIATTEKYFGVDDMDEYTSFVSNFAAHVKHEFRGLDSNRKRNNGKHFSKVPPGLYKSLELEYFFNSGFVWEGTTGWSANNFASDRQRVQEILKDSGIDISPTVLTSSDRGGERSAHKKLASFLQKRLLTYGRVGNSHIRGALYKTPAGCPLEGYYSQGFISPATVVAALEKKRRGSCRNFMLPDGFVKSVFASNAGLKSHSSPGEAHDSATKSTWTDSAAIERRQMKNGPLTELELIEEAICRYYEYLGRREAAYVLAHLVEDHDEYENALPQWLRDWFKDRQNNDPCASQALHWDFREWAAAETGNSNWDKVMRDIRYHGRASFPDFVQWVHLIVDYQRDMRSAWSILQDFHSKLMLDSASPVAVSRIAAAIGRYRYPQKFSLSLESGISRSKSQMYSVGVRALFRDIADSKLEGDKILGCGVYAIAVVKSFDSHQSSFHSQDSQYLSSSSEEDEDEVVWAD